MDGNGRWAKARGKARTEGHRAGTDALRKLVELSIRYGIAYLTVFSFSSENWSRPKEEVNFILGLMQRFVESDLEKLIQNNVRIRVIGARTDLSSQILKLIEKAESRTAANSGLELIVAFNYGGKAEITHAVRQIAERVLQGELTPDLIDEQVVAGALYAPDVPEPDVVLRTSGEVRFSNFLLWQAAYSELIFIDEYWPDFNEGVFVKVLEEYSRRIRRFGGVEARQALAPVTQNLPTANAIGRISGRAFYPHSC
jgi:undecaprenyl diphosphate synthase